MHKLKATLALSLILAAAAACSFTTANISSLKLYKDKDGNTEATTFARGDSIYAKATVSNVPSKVALKFRLITEDVKGQPQNEPVPNFDTTIEIPADGYGTYSLTPPTAGWPVGSYRIEVAMLIESGEQKDQESVKFTVEGGSAQTSAPQSTPDASQPTGDAKAGSIKLTRLRLTSNLKSDFDAPSESTFSPDEHVYVVYTAENVPGGGKIVCNLYAEKVEGVQPGENLRLLSYTNPTSDKFTESFDLDPTNSSGAVWGKGTYRVVLRSMDSPNGGFQQLQSIRFTVE